MPKYVYRCTACGHDYEKQEGFDAPSLQICPQCSGQARRVFVPPAIVFKGSGWYATDSRKSSSSVSEPKADSAKEASKETSTTTKSSTEGSSSAPSTPKTTSSD